jgi:hypothetical protein
MGNISGWTEAALFSALVVAVLTIAIVNFNGLYNKSYSIGLSANNTEQPFIDYQKTAETQIQGGNVEFDATSGITLKSSYGLAKDAIKISWNFISGGWIEDIVGFMGVGEAGTALARTLRIIYFLSLVSALLYALFKVVM